MCDCRGMDEEPGCTHDPVEDLFAPEIEPELDHIGLKGTDLHKRLEEFVLSHTDEQFQKEYSKRFHIHDPEQDGLGYDQISVDPVICKSMQWGPGCGHPVTHHLHAFASDAFPTSDCHCCDGRRWDPVHITKCGECQEHLIPKFERTIAVADGPESRPRVEMREITPQEVLDTSEEFIRTHKSHPSPEEMAEILGTTVEQVGEVIKAQVKMYTEAMGRIQQQMIPPKLNRAQRRARDKMIRRSRGR